MANWESRTLAESGIVRDIGEQASLAADSVTALATQISKIAEGAKLVLGGYADIIGAAIKASAQPLLDQLNDYRNVGFYCLVVDPFELNKPIDQPYGLKMRTDAKGGVIFKPSVDMSFDPSLQHLSTTGTITTVGDTYPYTLNLADLDGNYKDRNGRGKSHPNFIPPIPDVWMPPKLVRGGYDPATWTGTMPNVDNPGLPELTAPDCLQIMADAFDDEGDVPKFKMKNMIWPPLTDDPTVVTDGPFTEQGTAVDSFDPTANLAFHLYSSANTDLSLSDRGRLTKQIQAGKPNYAGSPGVTVSALVILCSATDPRDFYNTLKALANFFGGGGGVKALQSILIAAEAFRKVFEPDNVNMTIECNTEYGTFAKGDLIIGESSNAVGEIVDISDGEKSIRTRTISDIRTDPETKDITSIWNRDVDMNPDGHWKTYDIEYTPKGDLTERFDPNERLYECESYQILHEGAEQATTYYRIKGEEGNQSEVTVASKLPKYGKVMGLSALAPNSVVPDFISFTAGQMIPGWTDFFDGLIELANGLIALAADALDFLNKLIDAIDDLTNYLIGILAKIKLFLAYLEKGLPNAGIWMLDIKTNGGNKAIQDALTSSSGAPPANYKFTYGVMLMSLELNGVDPLEKVFELLGMGSFQEVS